MDKYSHRHKYANENNQSSLRRKLTYLFTLMVVAGAAFSLYVYKPFSGLMHKITVSVFGAPHEDTIHEAKNVPPPIHFEFYTALPKAAMNDSRAVQVEAKQEKVQISSSDELEKEFSAMVDKKKETE